MGNNIILETKFVADISGSFYIPSYQRGYRWSETEVVRLLDDIYQNGKKNYCLQPVVVRKKEDQYELIDGQQRLTTLYLIYKYMKNVNPFFNEPAFTLSYQTRDQSEEFLKTLDMTKQDDNIDFWFISKAYNTIKEWFEQDLQIRVMHIFEYLKEDVKIIWYEVGESEDAISLFTRLNIGKIPLTSAELVKAMFLSRDNAENMRREKQEEISLQWDGIERELHNESLWFFLTNSVKGEYQTRIDLVLDLIAGKDESTREKYYTFFRFDELRKEVSLDDIWKKIYQTFLTLQYAWDELFHKSANAGFENTHTILVELLKSKESFDDGILDGIISAFLAQCEKDNLYPWNYYYVKYPVFRPGSYGKMSNDDVVNKPYMFSVMQTKTQWSQNTYMPYLKEADDDHLSRDEMGQYLVYDDVYIVCENNSYGVYRNDDDSLTDSVTISQNEAGIDTEDRIIKLKKYIANMK